MPSNSSRPDSGGALQPASSVAAAARPLARPVRFGTMGWSYEDWRGPFYSAGLPMSRALEEYAKIFDTVEIDSTFYGVPRPSTLDAWAAQVPPDFVFSAKVPRAVTHERRLIGAGEAALDFGHLLRDRFGSRLGALLVQLPPDFSDAERPALSAFLAALADARQGGGVGLLPWVFEFRHASWAGTDVADELAAVGAATATSERLDMSGEDGSALRYVRLLGDEGAVPRFDQRVQVREDDLATWAARIDAARANGGEGTILVYVRNFFEGHAPATILDLRARLGLPVPTPPGQQQMSLF